MAKQEKNLMQKTVDDLITYIIDHNMRPGDKLPNEQVLSELVNAGRSTIREAMRTLATRNIVEIRQGSGTYISEKRGMIEDPLGLFFIDDKAKLMKDLMDLRLQMEPDIAAMAALNATPRDILDIEIAMKDVEARINQKKDSPEEDIAFHQAVADSSKNLITPRLIPLLGTISRYISESDADLDEETISSHREIYEAIASHNPVAAKDAMYLHLVHSRRLLNKLLAGKED